MIATLSYNRSARFTFTQCDPPLPFSVIHEALNSSRRRIGSQIGSQVSRKNFPKHRMRYAQPS
ncbi:hypothetical protein OKW44_003970 [Paraburkholderia sp. WSM4174]